MSTTGVPAFAPEWLALREEADAVARATEPLPLLRGHERVVADLGCGTGSLGRWLAPRLAGPQHWVLYDRDPALLALAEENVPAASVATRELDLAALRSADLEGTTLVVASALLDVLTRDGMEALAGAVAAARCPALFSLSVVGRVDLSPSDPLDEAVTDAFNAHQRRGGLLGPDAVTVASSVFERLGARVRAYRSPWRLGAGHAALTAAWLRGWLGAAVEQDPALAGTASAYLRRRLDECARGELTAVVHHADLLVLPGEGEGAT